MLTAVLAWVLAGAAVLTGALVFRVDSMARATYLLLASFLCVGVELLLLGLGYLGVLVILMMLMEMVIMAVFMVMYMMNPAGLMPMTMVHNPRGSLVIAAGTFAALTTGILLAPWPRAAEAPPPDPTFVLGEALMEAKMLVMIVLGVVLFTTMVATVVLATHRGRYDRFGDDLRRPRAQDPVQGGVGR